ncbi:Cacna1h [Symbiodinium pilosum]|uniref:Cacna1h protein n=1 Tax=Symbiodinium pilosum TaxID=2952 RepID=A0A812JG76_SYMPI|nr:Cacna1h [Symbiodinium pilosum]
MSTMAAPELVCDHLVWCVESVADGMDRFEALTGIRPCVGGQHLGFGTHNALVSSGEGVYIELLAQDPSQPAGTWLGVDCEKKPRLTTFCVQRSDGQGGLDDTVAAAAKAGYDAGSIQDFSRKNTEGKTLRWRLASDHHRAGFATLPMAGLVPFVVDWSPNCAEGMEHPSAIAPKGCSLVEIRASHPDPPALQKILDAMNVKGVTVQSSEPGSEPCLEALLETPKGRVTLA